MTVRTTFQRQYRRHTVDIPVQLTICHEDEAQVSPTNGMTVPGRMMNISVGGAHVLVPMLLPRATRVDLEIPIGTKLAAGRVRARIMKMQMVTREPLYGLGLRFEDAESEVLRALQDMEEEGVEQ